jgi:ribosomal protein L11 methyltransferase
MPFLQLSFPSRDDTAAHAEAVCFELGALAVTLADNADDAILEPAPGATPLWPQVRVTALFSSTADVQALTRSLCATMAGLAAGEVSAEPVADRPWEREWLRNFHAMRFGRRLWVAPTHETVNSPDAVVVSMDPGLAFGTGTHATTALCLEWLDGARVTGRRLIDFGCGSGVLAVAALKLGAAHVHAVDIDPQALMASAANAAGNGVFDRIEIGAPRNVVEPVDILLANILAAPLIDLAPRFADLVVAGGDLVLSGLMASETDAVTLAYESWFDMKEPCLRDSWARIDGKRRPT